MTAETVCPTCGEQHADVFCRKCGEPRGKPLSFKRLLGDFFDQVLNWELSWPKTLRGTFLHPWKTSRAYLDGSRKPYVNPLKYAFILVTVYSLVILGFDINVVANSGGSAAINDAVHAGEKIIIGMASYLTLIALLPAAWVAAALFKRTGHQPAEYYVVLLYWLGNLFLITAILALAGLYTLPHAQWLQRLIALVYLSVWLGAFHERHDFGLIWRTLLVFLVYQVTVIICSMILLFGGSLLGWIDWSPFVTSAPG